MTYLASNFLAILKTLADIEHSKSEAEHQVLVQFHSSMDYEL